MDTNDRKLCTDCRYQRADGAGIRVCTHKSLVALTGLADETWRVRFLPACGEEGKLFEPKHVNWSSVLRACAWMLIGAVMAYAATGK